MTQDKWSSYPRLQPSPSNLDLSFSRAILPASLPTSILTGMASPVSHTPTISSTLSPTLTTPILAFTTPFAQPPDLDCSSLFTTTVSTYTDYITSYITWLLPDKYHPLYTACLAPQPAGPNQFTFSPAVCPERWVAWSLGKTGLSTPTGTDTTTLVSTAFCCAPEYNFAAYADDVLISPSCQRDLPFTPGTTSTGTAPEASAAQIPAWHIKWQTTDIPVLSPQPPAIELGDQITRWVPGSDNPERVRTDTGSGLTPGVFFFAAIGLPVLIVGAVVACFIPVCVSRARVGREKRAARARERGEGGTDQS